MTTQETSAAGLPDGPFRVPPQLNDINRAFWTGGRDGQLLITHCDACGEWTHPAAPMCRRCLSRDVKPEPVSGRGTVVTFTINHQRWSPAVAGNPYVVALVELAEQPGLRVLTNIVNIEPRDVTIGLPVTVTFTELDDVALPLFEPTRPE